MFKNIVMVGIMMLFSASCFAAEQKFTGVIEKIDIVKEVVTVQVKSSTNTKIKVIVKDALTMDKIKDKKIVVGDEVRIKYEDSTGEARLFRKTAGC